MKPNVLLLTVPWYYIKSPSYSVLPPIHLLYMAGYVAKFGYSAKVIDLSVEFGVQATLNDVLKFHQQLKEFFNSIDQSFNVIGISCYSSFQYMPTLDVVNITKSRFPKSKIIVGGYHPSAYPDDFLFPNSNIDCVVCGEGENALLNILNLVERGEELPSKYSAPVVSNLEDIPNVNHEMISNWSRYTHYYDYFSRGCPYSCHFCMEIVKGKRSWRSVSPKRAMQKIDEAVNNIGVTLLSKKNLYSIDDAIFGFDKNWRDEFLDLLEINTQDLHYFASPRIDSLDNKTIQKFANCGFSIDFPVESGSASMLSLMNKTRYPHDYLSLVKILVKQAGQVGLPYHTHWIVGHPGETRRTAMESLAFMEELHATNTLGMTEIFLFLLYPGSWVDDHWEELNKQYGSQIDMPEYWKKPEGIDEWRYHISPSKDLSRIEVLELVNNKIFPIGEKINLPARSSHEFCCGDYRESNDPWLL